MTNTIRSDINLTGDLTIGCIGATREALAAALSSEAGIVLAIADDAEVDLTFVQLIEAARREVERNGATLSLARPASGSLLETLERGGFLIDESGSRAAFWQGEV